MQRLFDKLTFKIENLGSVRRGEFTQKPLTLFCGLNNSGKTWAMYLLYHFYSYLDAMSNRRKDDELPVGIDNWKKFNQGITNTIPDLFNTPPDKLQNTTFEVAADLDWKDFVNAIEEPQNIFLLPAERDGLHLFFRELSMRRTALLHHASRENIDIAELLRDVVRSRYAIPIASYIDWLNNLTEIRKTRGGDFHGYAERLKKKLAGGAYRVDSNTGNIEFKPYQTRRDGRGKPRIGLHMTSSNVKSLFGLWFYLEYQAKPGNLLMIDEPELAIHPENQRSIARLLAELVNKGLNIVISTHSDYIVRELNSLIMLSQDKDGQLRTRHRYRDDEILRPAQVGAYLFDEQTIKPLEITSEDGICASTFDDVIEDLNKVNDDIYYSLQGRQAGQSLEDGA